MTQGDLAGAARVVRDPVGGCLAARLSGGAAALGTLLAARIVETPGETAGLPPREEARDLLRRAVATP
ncbi:hypothetical protein [Streptosporangium sp. NPDC001681]|uniref:hypothetical protein n=1 Tax=Streptosporangium sp. NPDC001681 TaxID=3154395 RepID=UPI003329D2F8